MALQSRCLGSTPATRRLHACSPQVVRAPSARVGIVRSSGNEAAELEKFGAGVRDALKLPINLPKEVPVNMSAMGSVDSSTNSMDGGLLELDKDTFYPYLEAQGDALVVVDFFTDWCGPCKMMYPKLVALSLERTDVRFVKFNCNKANKEIGQKLGIKVAPTFHFYRSGEKLEQMTGADINKLTALVSKLQPATVAA